MFRRLWQMLFGKSRPPDSGDRPALSPRKTDAGGAARSLQKVSAAKLMTVCDAYWAALSQPSNAHPASQQPSYGDFVDAVNELSTRGPEVLKWAAARLSHSEYDAREHAAFIVGEIASRHDLGDGRKALVKMLSRLAVRPVGEENKEAQANDAALGALAKIGDRGALTAIHRILTSPEWDENETQWCAAEALAQIVGEDFMDEDDPVETARGWLKKHTNARNLEP